MIENNIISIIEKNNVVYELLKTCPYHLLKHWKIRKFNESEIILNQGQKCNEFSIIIDGFVEIISTSESGKQYCQAIYKKGDYLGELEIFDNLNYCCSVVAMSRVTIIELEDKYFYELLEIDKLFIIKLMKKVCKSFYSLSLKASEDTMTPIKIRICRLLLGFINDNMYEKSTGKILIKKSKISDIIAVTTRSVDRCLKELRDDDIIKIQDGYIYIVDLEKLNLV